MKKNLLTTIVIFIYSSLSAMSMVFANVDIETSLPSGTYDKIIKVELIPTDPTAKIFYSFNPNGTPNDLIKYDGPILIKTSTPLIYWTFLTTDNESKIKRNDYVINFANDIKLSSGATFEDSILKNVAVSNTSSSPIDISYWEARNDLGKVVIPEGTILNAGQNYDISGLTGTGIISLFSPNEEKKDFMEVQFVSKEVALIQEVPAVIKKTPFIPRKVAKIPKKSTIAVLTKPVTVPPEIKATDSVKVTPPVLTPSTENVMPPANLAPNETNPTTTTPPVQEPINNDFNNSIKASTQESDSTGSSSGRYIIIGVLAVAALGGAGMKFAKKS